MSEFQGMTRKKCPDACTEDRCIISTVAICKHPFMVGPSGCGPVTIENQERARRYIKHLEIDGGKGVEHAEQEPGPARIRGDVVKRRGPKKAARARKKTNAPGRRARISEGGQGQEDQPAREAREEEVTT